MPGSSPSSSVARRWTFAGALAALLLLATAAQAQDDLPAAPVPAEPGQSCYEQTRLDNCDTDYTPIAKESELWQPIQGARYDARGPETEDEYRARQASVANSADEQVTDWDDELTDVHFMNARNGFAAGQRKIDCDNDGEPETYVPVVYRYGDSQTGLRWLPPTEEHGGFLGSCDSPGFIGQLTWIRTTGMALAVGGTGSYPYRAPAYGEDIEGNPCEPDPDKPYGANCDQAGVGRAWLFNHGTWQELDEDPDSFPLPSAPNEWDGLRGMTALAFSPVAGDHYGFAGGLGQVWPVLVKVSGENGPCPAADANACVSFPAGGEIPDLGGAIGRFDMWSRKGPEPVPTDGSAPVTPSTSTNCNNRPEGVCKRDTDSAFRFRFRVRQIRMESVGGAFPVAGAVAVTDGCCAGSEELGDLAPAAGAAHDYPSVLVFGPSPLVQIGPSGWGWKAWTAEPTARAYEGPAYHVLPEERRRRLPPPNPRRDMPESFYSATLFWTKGSGDRFARVGVIASPGGPAPSDDAREEPSVVSEPICMSGDFRTEGPQIRKVAMLEEATKPGPVFGALRAQLASVRLVDGDGDDLVAYYPPVGNPINQVNDPPYAGSPSNAQRFDYWNNGCDQGRETRRDDLPEATFPTRDGVPDWAVGELRSTEVEGLGARGLAYSTVSRPTSVPETLDADSDHIASDPLDYEPTSAEKLQAFLRSQHFYTGSYALSAIDYIDGSGSGWAVGAHGAVAQLGGEGAGLSAAARPEPAPPRLSGRSAAAAPERSPYEEHDRPATEPAAVPALAAQPSERLAEAELRPVGAPSAAPDYGGRPNRLGQIVISRDGSEGWGLDREPFGTTAMSLFRYEGGQWRRCDPEGFDGALAPEPACSELAALRAYSIRGQLKGVRIAAAARIPYENDAYPTNDDEFEVVAIGSGYRTPEEAAREPEANAQVPPTLLRYREGAWTLEDDKPVRAFLGRLDYAAQVTAAGFNSDVEMAFASPEDGWAASVPDDGQRQPSKLLRFDGERWIDCSTKTGPGPADSGVADSEGEEATGAEGRELRRQWCEDPDALTILAHGDGGSIPQDLDRVFGIAAAGERVYLYGGRSVGDETHPMILCKDAGGPWRSAGCGLDPGLAVRRGEAGEAMTGVVRDLSVVADGGGGQVGWARGSFSGEGEQTSLLRLGRGGWAPYSDEGPLRDRLGDAVAQSGIVALPDGGGLLAGGEPFRFEPETGRWRPFPADLPGAISGLMAPDNRGGAWIGQASVWGGGVDDLLHYSATPPRRVFEEAPSPLPGERQSFTALAGEPDGTVWATTSAGAALYRYKRTTGWDRMTIPGWQQPRATVSPQAFAIAVNDSGSGVVVGREGRIANLEGESVRLDAAAGTLCDLADVAPPCGTSRHLRAAAVAPDGSAIVGGEQLSLLWRPAGGDFRAIERPEAAPSAQVTGLSMPSAQVAYLATNKGQVFRGSPAGAGWSWRLENVDGRENLLTRDPAGIGPPLALNALAVDADGNGYAAGQDGVLLRRDGDRPSPWRRIRSGVGYELGTLLLVGEGALIGGAEGVVLTGAGDEFRIARSPDLDGHSTGDVVGLAVSGGPSPGQTEAWAASDGPGAPRNVGRPIRGISQLFHYASDRAEPLLDPRASGAPLPDAPAPRRGELSLAALGKLDCHLDNAPCPGHVPVGFDYAVASRRASEEIASRSRRPGGPALSVFSGDIVNYSGLAGAATSEDAVAPPEESPGAVGVVAGGHLNGQARLRAARSWVAEPLEDAGLGFFSALGGQDLASLKPCPGEAEICANRGTSDAWRKAFAGEAEPWGSGEGSGEGGETAGRYEVEPVAGSGAELALEDQDVDSGSAAGRKRAFLAGARTHYAFDLVEPEDGVPAARLVFADNAMRSLAASDPQQNPIEAAGQAQWLESVLCFEGASSECTREEGRPAIVVANAPTYSYAPTDPSFNATDAAQFEALMLRHRVTAVISGSLGWNGRYWATAAGVHEPCPGEGYRDVPPAPGTRSCGGHSTEELPIGADGFPEPPEALAGPAAQVQNELTDLTGEGLLPFVVASGAGGKLAGADPSEGFWHGYTIVRVPADGSPAGLVVEQRPLLDFLSLSARSHTVSPRGRLRLEGVGRGPIAYDSSSSQLLHTADFLPIDTQAITHRYDLVLADPEEPWLPCEAGEIACEELHAGLAKPSAAESAASDASASDGAAELTAASPSDAGPCAPYLCLPERIGTVDRTTGEVRAGDGRYPDTFAIAMLSVADHVATYPLAFERAPSFVVKSALRTPSAPKTANPQTPRPPGQPPIPEPPAIPKIELPAIPAPPAIPSLTAAAPPEPQPPAPPAPPPPSQQPAALDLTVAPPGVSISTPTALIQPPTPPVNPAPPGGARREARQRQAAAQKGGADSSEAKEQGVDLAEGPPQARGSSEMTRLDHEAVRRPQERMSGSMTLAGSTERGGSPALLYGGGITIAALVMAMTYGTLRPTPRGRSPEQAAPAYARSPHRGSAWRL